MPFLEFLLRAISAIVRFVRLHRNAALFWQAPRVCDIVIFDGMSADAVRPLLRGRDHVLLHTRGEQLCLAPGVVFRTALGLAKGASPMNAYSLALLQIIRPKLVLTFVDNNSAFSFAASRFSAHFVAIQNGARVMANEAPEDPSTLCLPVFFCFGQNDVEQFTRCGASVGEFRPIGSLRNHAYEQSGFFRQWHDRYDVCLISEAEMAVGSSEPLGISAAAIASSLALSRDRLGLKVCIVARSHPDTEPERFASEQAFYRQFFGHNLDLIPNVRSEFTSYRAMDNSKVVAGFCSTALYEAVRRGRTVLVSSATPGFYDFPIAAPWVLQNPTPEIFAQTLRSLLNSADDEFQRSNVAAIDYLMPPNSAPAKTIADYIERCMQGKHV